MNGWTNEGSQHSRGGCYRSRVMNVPSERDKQEGQKHNCPSRIGKWEWVKWLGSDGSGKDYSAHGLGKVFECQLPRLPCLLLCPSRLPSQVFVDIAWCSQALLAGLLHTSLLPIPELSSCLLDRIVLTWEGRIQEIVVPPEIAASSDRPGPPG